MGYEVSRRSFLKGAAALAVATAASGLLTACGGGKGDGYTIGEYTVYLSLQSYGWMNEKKNPYGFVIPEVKIKGKKSGFNNKSYKEMFALKVGDVEFKLDENKRVTLIQGKTVDCLPKFTTTDETAYNAAISGEKTLEFSITLSARCFRNKKPPGGFLRFAARRAGRTHKEMGGISAFWREM